MTSSRFVHAVIAVVKSLKRGQVATYGEVAARAGYPGAARAVGNVLSASVGLPWWRVVAADGRLASPNRVRQAELLGREGISVRKGQIVGWERKREPRARSHGALLRRLNP